MPASEDFTPLDTLKRYLSAPRRMVGEGLESLATLPQRAFQASEQMRTEGPYDPGPALEAAMLPMGTGAIAGAPVRAGETALGAGPIRAYHSSPHDFDKFDLSKIGTGEGAQVYGHGLYFAENPAVSGQGGQYWNQFLSRFKGNERAAATELAMNKFNRETSIANMQDQIAKTNEALKTGTYPEPARYGPSRDKYEAMLRDQQAQLKLLESGQPVGPRTYEVNINADPAHMLDWDKPLTTEMREKIAVAARQIPSGLYDNMLGARSGLADVSVTGQTAEGMLSRRLGSRAATAAAFRDVGIPGIKYLDQGSRGAFVPASRQHMYKPWGGQLDVPKPSSNYVVSDPTILDIVKKYGLAGLASAPALTSGLRDRENQP